MIMPRSSQIADDQRCQRPVIGPRRVLPLECYSRGGCRASMVRGYREGRNLVIARRSLTLLHAVSSHQGPGACNTKRVAAFGANSIQHRHDPMGRSMTKTMDDIFFEDVIPGDVIRAGPYVIPEDELLNFA